MYIQLGTRTASCTAKSSEATIASPTNESPINLAKNRKRFLPNETLSSNLPCVMSRKKLKKKKIIHREVDPRFSALTADRHELYQLSVQDVEPTLELFQDVYTSRNEASPMKLREDFCGTAFMSANWTISHPDRTAVGIDIDANTLDWGREHNLSTLGDDAARVTLIEQDVRSCPATDFDIVAAFNFSYCVFHQRADLLSYFRHARDSLAEGGFFILDLHGGPDAQFILEEPKNMGEFDYVWEQELFDPINNRTVCHIHFHFRDGTKMKRAFTYDWRHWSLPELKDILSDAGFDKVETWWDDDDDVIRIKESAVNTEAWLAYLVAWK